MNSEMDQKIEAAALEMVRHMNGWYIENGDPEATKLVAALLRKHFAPLLPAEPQIIWCDRCMTQHYSTKHAAEQPEPAKDEERKRS